MSDQPANAREREIADTLGSAILLAFAGGSIDGFMYLNHGHTFAAAQTGNFVLCGVAMLERNRQSMLQHLLPALAFVVGIWCSEWLGGRGRYGISLGLAAEIAGLLACSFLPGSFPDLLYIPIISLLASYQVANFRNAGPFSYNSTFVTGNLRTAILGLYNALTPAHRPQGLRQAAALGGIILSFLLGAMLSATLAGHLFNHTLWLPAAVLSLVLARTVLAA